MVEYCLLKLIELIGASYEKLFQNLRKKIPSVTRCPLEHKEDDVKMTKMRKTDICNICKVLKKPDGETAEACNEHVKLMKKVAKVNKQKTGNDRRIDGDYISLQERKYLDGALNCGTGYRTISCCSKIGVRSKSYFYSCAYD